MTKQEIFEMIDSRVDKMQGLMVECIDMIYNAGYNDALEKMIDLGIKIEEIKGLKK